MDLVVDLVLMNQILKHQQDIEGQEIHQLNLHHKEIRVDKVDMAAVAVAALVLVPATTLQLLLFMQDMVVMVVMVFRFLLQDHLQQKLVH